jgi:hypothetical protein
MNPWIATSQSLPQDGDAVLFVVEHRGIVLCGIYTSCTFKSRWSCYSPGDVSEWRRLDVGATGSVYNGSPSGEAAERPAARAA